MTGFLYLFWRRVQKTEKLGKSGTFLSKSGQTFGLMFICYGIMRFLLELVRDDNPFESTGLTVSQNIGLAMIVLGIALMIIFNLMKPPQPCQDKAAKPDTSAKPRLKKR